MEDSWQVKCGSTLQSSMQSVASSTSQGPRNQMEMNAGPYLYPHVVQDCRLLHGQTQNPVFPNIPNLSSDRLVQADLGNSFVALLSGPPSLLQCDFHELLNPKLFTTSSKLPTDSRSVSVSVGSRAPLASAGQVAENLSNQNMQNRAEFGLAVPSRTAVSSHSPGYSVLHDNVQSVGSWVPLASARLVSENLSTQNMQNGAEFRPVVSSRPVGELCDITPANGGELRSTNNRMSEVGSSGSDQSSSSTSGCPRVFCFGKRGHLLLSNTGLLGILCSCHCYNMSVSKFCEHSGLHDINPGDAVRMDSGETIAQWRKLNFQRFGIRVPDDQSGWEWPEGISSAAGVGKSSGILPSMSINSSLTHRGGICGDFMMAGVPLDNILLPNDHYVDENLVAVTFRDKKQRNVIDSNSFLFKGLSTSKSNASAVMDNLTVRCPISSSSTMSNVVGRGPGHGHHLLPSSMDSTIRIENSTRLNFQNSQNHGKIPDVSRIKNARDNVTMDRDPASSNVELRLGQPFHQIKSSENPVPSVGPKGLDALVEPLKSLFSEQMSFNAVKCREKEESRQHLPRAAVHSDATTIREQNQLNLGNHVFGNKTTICAARLENFMGDVAKNSVHPKHFNGPPEGSLSLKVTNNLANINEPTMPKGLSFISHTANCDPVEGPCSGCNHIERQVHVSDLGLFQLMDKCVADVSNASTGLLHRVQKQPENPSSFSEVVGGSTDSGLSAVHGKISFSCQLPIVPLDAFGVRNLSDNLDKVLCPGNGGNADHMFLRPTGPLKGPVQALPSQAVSTNFPTSTAISIPGVTHAVSKQDSFGVSPYLLDENMRLLALGQLLELSKQQHALSILGMSQKHGRFGGFSNVNTQHSVVDLSASAELKHGQNPSCHLDGSEVAIKSLPCGFTERTSSNIEKVAPATGLNMCNDSSKLTQGISCSIETDVQSQCFHDSVLNDWSALRSEKIVSQSNRHENYCSRALRTCFHCSHDCAAHTKLLAGNCDSTVGSCPNTFKQWMGGLNGEASKLVASESVEKHLLPKGDTISSVQGRLIMRQLPKDGVSHVPQWRDVPSKLKRACDVSADVLNGNDCGEGQVGVRDTTAKCRSSALQVADSLKEQEMSNISSGSSAPVVTHASIEVNNMELSIVNAGDTGCANYSVVDEGSGIDKCWSSDDALESERSADFISSTCKTELKGQGSSRYLTNQSSRTLLEELKLLDSLTWKKGRNQSHNELTAHGKINHHPEKCARGLKIGERKKGMKSKFLGVSSLNPTPTVRCKNLKGTGAFQGPSCSSKDLQKHLPISQGKYYLSGSPVRANLKSGAHSLSLVKAPSRKRDLYALYNGRAAVSDCQTEFDGNASCCEILEASCSNKCQQTCTSKALRRVQKPELPDSDAFVALNYNSVGCTNASSSQPLSVSRPVVCGKYGEISSEKLDGDNSKPVTYLSLSIILKRTKKCTLLKNSKPTLISSRELRKTCLVESHPSYDKFLNLKKEKENGGHPTSFCDEMDVDVSVEETKRGCTDGEKQSARGLFMLEKEKDGYRKRGCSIIDSDTHAHLKPKCKEIRKRSLYELTVKGMTSSSKCFSPMKKSKCIQKQRMRKFFHNAEDSRHHLHSSCEVNTGISIQKQWCFSNMDSDAFCCVCGSSNQDDINCILKCSRCLINVHQACYGVSRVPKGRWYCRPCKTSSKDIVCVLCGYGGGAMTQALRSRTIVKSLLKAWNTESEDQPQNRIPPGEPSESKISLFNSSGSVIDGDSLSVLAPVNLEPLNVAEIKMCEPNRMGLTQSSASYVRSLKVPNSITAGMFDPTVKQWVHMVCGLWTPRTRCPNVDTMSAFDVSGVSRPGANVVCSLCNRPGGSSIQCRVVNCSVQFHPWCAHQKGLLQSEVEGADNENVGFYGRCVLHARFPMSESDKDLIDSQKSCLGEELTCARTEGYKGRKRDGFWHNLYGQSKGKNGCLVPQEQLNAWTHINGQKSCTQGLPKLPMSDVEYDCRKEYARYKQAKGWKRLVVYKSGIHALGLYTSQFISRGEMVVEYVGEIVGQRVADKRENEYLSGRKLQYKSACYFFRIDKEHIIDATCKGGIARFVNHSCLPNCVAKVISVRNEKKVVFFAERDIYPGEEITYDYHFNHEDEGKKIPCFCNSKNCRRYMN